MTEAYLLGDNYGPADIMLWMLIRWHPEPKRLSEKAPRRERVAELVRARPAITRTWQEHEED